MSLRSRRNQAFDDVVIKLIASGITAVVSAGNDSSDAGKTSPGDVLEAITVASSDITNTMAWDSNFGAVVDIFAPGVQITSAWIGGRNRKMTLSGTSMATPHVAGFAACLLSQNTSMTPDAVDRKIKALATPNVIKGVPVGTVSSLLFNGGAQ